MSRIKAVPPRLAPLIALAWALLALVLGQQTQATHTQQMGSDTLPNVHGLGQVETGEHGPFRWSGDTVRVELQPLGYPLYARLNVQGVRPEGAQPATLAISSGGKDLGTFTLPANPTTIEVKLPASTLAEINPTLEIGASTFQPPGDRRTLGAVFYSIEQRSGPAPALPSSWPAAWLLLSTLLWYFVAWLLWRRADYALAGSGAWGAVLGLLNGVARPWLVNASLYMVVPPLVLLLTLPWLRSLSIERQTYQFEEAATPKFAVTERPWRIAIPIALATLVLTAWHLIAASVPSGNSPTDNLTWGVAFYGALPLPLQLTGAVVVLGAVGWALLSKVPPQAEPEPEPEPERQPDSTLLPARWIVLACGAALLICSLLPVRFSEGDSSEFDRKIPIGAIWRERELLDFYLKAKLWQWSRAWLPRPSQVYVVVSNIAGAIYTAGALLLGRTVARTRAEVWLIAGGLLAIGNALLFFGYVESYALVNVTSLFVLWACWRYTQGRIPFGTVGALATLAPLFHGSALWWGPMVAAAWLLRARLLPAATRWRTALRELAQGVGVGLAMLLLMLSVAIMDGYDFERLQAGLGELGGLDGRTMLPLFTPVSPYEHYVYFSWPHLGAVIQEQLLTAPMALLTIIVLLCVAWPGIKRLARAAPPMITLAVGAASMFYYTTAWNPDLGPRSDWDLLSLAAPALTLLALCLLVRLPFGRARRLALASYLSVSAVHAAAWVLVHVLGIAY